MAEPRVERVEIRRLDLPVLEGLSGSLAARHDFNTQFSDQDIWKAGLRQDFGYGLYARASGGTPSRTTAPTLPR